MRERKIGASLTKRNLRRLTTPFALLALVLPLIIIPITYCNHQAITTGNTSNIASGGTLRGVVSPKVIPIYVIGTLDNHIKLRKVLNLSNGKAIKISINRLEVLHTPPLRLGVIVITRKLRSMEEIVLEKCFLRGFVVVSLGKAIHNQINKVLSHIATITIDANGTELYVYKLIGKYPINGRYPVLIAGYAGKGFTEELLKDAVVALNTATNDRRVVALIKWSSNALWKPYGRLNVVHTVYKYLNDPWPDKDLYAVRCLTEIISGSELGWMDNGYTWFNDFIKSRYELNYHTNIYDLVDYDPSSMSGGSVRVTLTFPSATWSYSGNYILSIDDDSDVGVSVAGWFHDIGTWYSPGVLNTVKVAPGFAYIVSPVESGEQRWVINGGWVGIGLNPGVPLKHFTGTVVIIVRFT